MSQNQTINAGNGNLVSGVERFEDSRSKQPNQPYIIDLDNLEKLMFQNIPDEISVDPESTFVALETPGRNVPNYHFTGSETTIKFSLSYYCDHPTRQDVITKCRWLEALTMNDGYIGRVHHVAFGWGDLYTGQKFIVTAAPYKLNLFDREYNMLPRYAKQEVTLKRISEKQLTRKDLLFNPINLPVNLLVR